jgi:hypothetical protein
MVAADTPTVPKLEVLVAVAGSAAIAAASPAVPPWPVALPMLNDPGQEERKARRCPIAPPAALWVVAVVLSDGLSLPPVVEAPSLGRLLRRLVGH